MTWNYTARLGLLLALCMAAGGRLEAQNTDSSTKTSDSSAVKSDSGDTYVTLDGYGLGRIVPGSLSVVTSRARVAMIRMKIVEERSRSLGKNLRELRGTKGNLDVSIVLKFQSTSSTRVEVNAREGLTGWDKGFEKQLLDAIGKT